MPFGAKILLFFYIFILFDCSFCDIFRFYTEIPLISTSILSQFLNNHKKLHIDNKCHVYWPLYKISKSDLFVHENTFYYTR